MLADIVVKRMQETPTVGEVRGLDDVSTFVIVAPEARINEVVVTFIAAGRGRYKMIYSQVARRLYIRNTAIAATPPKPEAHVLVLWMSHDIAPSGYDARARR